MCSTSLVVDRKTTWFIILCMKSSSKLRQLKPRFFLLHLTLVDKRDLKTLHARVNTVQLLFDIVIYHYFFCKFVTKFVWVQSN